MQLQSKLDTEKAEVERDNMLKKQHEIMMAQRKMMEANKVELLNIELSLQRKNSPKPSIQQSPSYDKLDRV